jgi:hypothetical protein
MLDRDYIMYKIEELKRINDDEMTRPEIRERNRALIQFYINRLKEE